MTVKRDGTWLVDVAGHRKRLTERSLSWDKMPLDVVITRLSYIPPTGPGIGISGCEAYGFQRWRLDTPMGQVGSGAQIIGIKGGRAHIHEFDDVTGSRRKRVIAIEDLTYNRELLRRGRR